MDQELLASGQFAQSSTASAAGWPERAKCEGDRKDAAAQNGQSLGWYP